MTEGFELYVVQPSPGLLDQALGILHQTEVSNTWVWLDSKCLYEHSFRDVLHSNSWIMLSSPPIDSPYFLPIDIIHIDAHLAMYDLFSGKATSPSDLLSVFEKNYWKRRHG